MYNTRYVLDQGDCSFYPINLNLIGVTRPSEKDPRLRTFAAAKQRKGAKHMNRQFTEKRNTTDSQTYEKMLTFSLQKMNAC